MYSASVGKLKSKLKSFSVSGKLKSYIVSGEYSASISKLKSMSVVNPVSASAVN